VRGPSPSLTPGPPRATPFPALEGHPSSGLPFDLRIPGLDHRIIGRPLMRQAVTERVQQLHYHGIVSNIAVLSLVNVWQTPRSRQIESRILLRDSGLPQGSSYERIDQC
jgi:hypothetical protein